MSRLSLYKKRNIFLNTFLILILSTIIPVIIINSIIYYYFTSVILEQTYDEKVFMVEKASRINDLVMGKIDSIMSQMANNVNIISFVVNPDIGFYNSSRNKIILSNLENMAQSNEGIESVYVYSTLSNILLSSNGGGFTLNDFYDKQWINTYNSMKESRAVLESRKVGSKQANIHTDCITVIMNLPYQSKGKLGAIVVNLKVEDLYKNIRVSDNDSNTFFVLNKEGKVILHKDKYRINDDFSKMPHIQEVFTGDKGVFVEKIDGYPMLVTYATSGINNWKYINIIPMAEVQSNYKFVSNTVIIVMCLYLLFGIIVLYCISRGISNPIRNLIKTVSAFSPVRKPENESEYEYLNHTYNDVIGKYKYMEDVIGNIKPIIKEKLLSNIILGKIDNTKEIKEKMDLIQLDLGLNNFIVILMQIDDYENLCEKYNEKERNMYKFEFIKAVESNISKQYKAVCIEIESDKFATLVNFDDNIDVINTQKEINLTAKIIKNQVELNFPFTITIGIGKMYKDITNVNLSYREAVKALKYKIYQGKNEVINIDDVEGGYDELYYYHFEKERMLLNNIKMGSKESVESLVRDFFDEIRSNKNISFEHMRQGLTNVVSSVIEIIINKGLTVEGLFGAGTNLYKQLSGKETIEDVRTWFVNVCNTTAHEIEKITLSSTSKNIQKIVEYINANLDKEITLNDIADEMGLSVTYVSKIFKNNLGVKYIDYVNSSRIEKAKSLLKDTMVPIKEVGFKVGFNNIQTFIRVFKKYEGITPGQFRDNS